MIEFSVKSIYTGTNVSKGNESFWKTLIDQLDVLSVSKEDINFDFRGIELDKPWNNEMFKKFISNEHVYMTLYTSGAVARTIETMLMIGGLKTNRVKNIDIVVKAPKKVDEKLMKTKERLKEVSTDNGDGTVTIDIYKNNIWTQIGYVSSTNAIDAAIRDLHEEMPDKKFIVALGRTEIQPNMYIHFANMLESLKNDGIIVELVGADAECLGKISIFRCIDVDKPMKVKEKLKLLRDNIPPNTVGMLSEFASTKKLDMFGRMGDGVPITCRPAIFRAVKNENGSCMLVFDTYVSDANSFSTDLDFRMNNNGDGFDGIECIRMKVDLREMGLCDLFVGKRFHFNMPISEELMTSFEAIDDCDDYVNQVEITLPEYIKKVFDENKVKYNVDVLNEVIRQNREMMG